MEDFSWHQEGSGEYMQADGFFGYPPHHQQTQYTHIFVLQIEGLWFPEWWGGAEAAPILLLCAALRLHMRTNHDSALEQCSWMLRGYRHVKSHIHLASLLLPALGLDLESQ